METQTIRSGEFLLSEGNGHISRETVTILTGQSAVLSAGTLLGTITATGKYSVYDGAATDGTEVASAILYNANVDATVADAKAVAVVRMAEVKRDYLTGLDADAEADLLTNNIIIR